MTAAGAAKLAQHELRAMITAPQPIEELPCWTCSHPRAVELRHHAQQTGEIDEAQRSPATGLLLGCCRVRLVSSFAIS